MSDTYVNVAMGRSGAAGNGSSWDLMAVVERLEELKYIRRIECGAWQDGIYVPGAASLP